MKPITAVLLAGLMLAGCVHRHVTVVESSPAGEGEVYEDEAYTEDEVVLEEACEPVWDGHTYVVVESHQHGFGCGHFFHHGCWHLHPFDWIYVEVGFAHCGETGGFFYAGDPWARVWDGCAFVMLRGHVHGSGCGHHYHHGCWNTCPSDHVYADRRRSHFSKSPPPRHSEMAVRVRGSEAHAMRSRSGGRVETESASRRAGAPAMRSEPARAAAPGREVRDARAPGRRQDRQERPAAAPRPEPERRIEPPARREAPPRREQPQRIEQPRKEEPPQRREAPQRIEQPKKQEAPRRIEPPQRREPPKKEQPPQRREAPKEREKEKRR